MTVKIGKYYLKRARYTPLHYLVYLCEGIGTVQRASPQAKNYASPLMMIQLIADSGATKADWRITSANAPTQAYQTTGIQPFQQSYSNIVHTLTTELLAQCTTAPLIDAIHFYGAGVSTHSNKETVEKALAEVFPTAQNISIYHDTLAAARATCGREAGVACILGTGANASLYDGTQIISQERSLGYVLGDEGSGAYLGKKVLKDYLLKRMPDDILHLFSTVYPDVNRATVLESIYQKPFANRYLAQFARFLGENINETYCYQRVYSAFTKFFKRYVAVINPEYAYKVHFVGSVAYYFQQILRQVSREQGFQIGEVLEQPIEGLVRYHSE